MPTPGLIYAAGKITNPKFTDEAFNKWYNTVHVPQTLSVNNGPRAGYRFQNSDPEAPFSYLALYPSSDVFAENNAAEVLTDRDSLIPDGESYLDLTSWDARIYAKLETVGDTSTTKVAKCLIAVSYEPGKNSPDTWFDAEHLSILQRQPGYVRSHGFKAVTALAAGGTGPDDRKLPKYLAFHEFDTLDLPPAHMETYGPDENRRIFKDAEICIRDVWTGIFEAGDAAAGL